MKKIMFQTWKERAANEERGGTTNPRRHNSYNYNHYIDLGIEATVTIQETTITNIIHNAKDNT